MADIRFLPFSLRAELSLLCPATFAVRQPGYLLQASSRRPIGFAPPPCDGFALIATPERQRF
jgi:hypothetical protein